VKGDEKYEQFSYVNENRFSSQFLCFSSTLGCGASTKEEKMRKSDDYGRWF
jgi:hypothetical protein